MATETGVLVNRRKSLLGLGGGQQEATKLDKSLLDVINLKITKIEWTYDGNQIVSLRFTLNDSIQSPIFGNSKAKLSDHLTFKNFDNINFLILYQQEEIPSPHCGLELQDDQGEQILLIGQKLETFKILNIKEGSYIVGGKAKSGMDALYYFEPMMMKLPK